MLIVTNMLGDSARKINERDKCSGSAGSTHQHPIVSREDLQMFAVLHSLKRHRPIIVCFYPVLDKFGDWNSFGREMALSSRIPIRLARGAENTSNFRSGTWLFTQPPKKSMSPYAWNIGVNSFTWFTARRKQNFCCSGRAFSGLTSWFTFIFASTDEQMFHSIGVQNPTTKNAFSEAQKFIIISVISKGFSSCLASEFSSTHLSREWQQSYTSNRALLAPSKNDLEDLF